MLYFHSFTISARLAAVLFTPVAVLAAIITKQGLIRFRLNARPDISFPFHEQGFGDRERRFERNRVFVRLGKALAAHFQQTDLFRIDFQKYFLLFDMILWVAVVQDVRKEHTHHKCRPFAGTPAPFADSYKTKLSPARVIIKIVFVHKAFI